MAIDSRKLGIPSSVTSDVDLHVVGQEIYDVMYRPTRRGRATDWKKQARRREVQIRPDHLYSPSEVAAVLSVSYDTAARIMTGTKRTANLAKPRARKRLLRLKGSDLRKYIQDKIE